MTMLELGLEIWELIAIVGALAVVYLERREHNDTRSRLEELRLQMALFEADAVHGRELADLKLGLFAEKLGALALSLDANDEPPSSDRGCEPDTDRSCSSGSAPHVTPRS